jgi:hypothetical protein
MEKKSSHGIVTTSFLKKTSPCLTFRFLLSISSGCKRSTAPPTDSPCDPRHRSTKRGRPPCLGARRIPQPELTAPARPRAEPRLLVIK